MHHKQKVRGMFCMALPCAVVLLFSPHQATGQNVTPPLPDKPTLDKQHITLHITQKKLTEVVTQLSDALERNIVVDDEPSEQRFDVEVTGSGRDALEAVAAACDYSWSLNRRGIIMMRKAFRKPTTLPQINLPEMRQMAQDGIDALSAFHCSANPAVWENQILLVARSFTPVQLEQLHTGQTLHTVDLSLEQNSLLQQVIVNHAFSSLLGGWMALLDALEQMPASSLEMRAVTERRRGVESKGVVLDQVRQGSGGKEVRTRLVFQPDEKPEEKKP